MRLLVALVGGLLVFVTLVSPVAVSAYTDSVTVAVSPTSLASAGPFYVSGNAYAASGSVYGTAVVISVKNSNGDIVTTTQASVSGSGASGTYEARLVAGGTTAWVTGYYNVTATYSTSLSGTPATATTAFFYGANSINTSTLTISTSPSQATIAGYSGAQLGYTNTYPQSLSALVWVVAKNSAGQTMGVFVGSATMNSQQSVTVFVPTLNLPGGSYSATIFATTLSSVAISQVSTMSLSIPGQTSNPASAQVAVTSAVLPASDFMAGGGSSAFTCSTSAPVGQPYLVLTNTGTAGANVTGLTLIWAGSNNEFTPPSASCEVDAAGSPTSTIYLDLPASSTLTVTAVAGQPFAGTLALSSGETISFTGTFQ